MGRWCVREIPVSASKAKSSPASPPSGPALRIAKAFSGLEAFVEENHPLAKHTWYKIGGPARYFVRPRNNQEVADAAARCVENNIPIFVLGLGANLLVSDEGIDGAVFRFDQEHWRQTKPL